MLLTVLCEMLLWFYQNRICQLFCPLLRVFACQTLKISQIIHSLNSIFRTKTFNKFYFQNKDISFYTQNGLLNMLDRNKRIKGKPEKFQRCNEEFDLIVTCQERVFDQVLECKF